MPPAPTRWAPSAAGAGPNGTAATATTCGSSGGATRGCSAPLATRLAGSSDLYQPSGRRPFHSINFITAHDGFTLNDLVSYNDKHNEANGEDNRDGENTNYSFNYGVEGPTWHKGIERIRQRQIKNMLASLLLSQGVPMLLAGDEFRRTQRGNNNAYCQDNEISWVDWRLLQQQPGAAPLRAGADRLPPRRAHRAADEFPHRPSERPDGLPDLAWYGAEGRPMDWGRDDREPDLPVSRPSRRRTCLRRRTITC